jgi:hypothetical protein
MEGQDQKSPGKQNCDGLDDFYSVTLGDAARL